MKDDEAMFDRLVALGRSGALSRSMVPVLMRIAEQGEARTSSVAVQLLGKLGGEAADDVGFLAELLRVHRSDAFGRTIARALGSIGAAAHGAIPELRLAAHSDNAWVRKEARVALKKIEASDSKRPAGRGRRAESPSE